MPAQAEAPEHLDELNFNRSALLIKLFQKATNTFRSVYFRFICLKQQSMFEHVLFLHFYHIFGFIRDYLHLYKI